MMIMIIMMIVVVVMIMMTLIRALGDVYSFWGSGVLVGRGPHASFRVLRFWASARALNPKP